MPKKNELKASDLRFVCDPKIFKFKNTSEIKPLKEVIGQKRAVQAIDFGLNMKSPGYNIFVTGVEGTGKSTIVKDIVTKHAKTMPGPDGWCLLNNFKDQFRPKAIAVSWGKAVRFSKTINKLIEDLKSQFGFEYVSFDLMKKIGKMNKENALVLLQKEAEDLRTNQIDTTGNLFG